MAWFLFCRLAEYLALLQDYRNMQEELAPVMVEDLPQDIGSEIPENNDIQGNSTDGANINGMENSHLEVEPSNHEDNSSKGAAHTNGAADDSTNSDATTSQPNQELDTTITKTLTLAERRAQLLSNELDVDDFPDPDKVTDEQIQEYLGVFDLPEFPSLKKQGKKTIFTTEQEKHMMEYLKDVDAQGFGRTMEEFQTDMLFYYKCHKPEKSKKACVFSKLNFKHYDAVSLKCHTYFR